MADRNVIVGGILAEQINELEFVGVAPADQSADVADGDLLRQGGVHRVELGWSRPR